MAAAMDLLLRRCWLKYCTLSTPGRTWCLEVLFRKPMVAPIHSCSCLMQKSGIKKKKTYEDLPKPGLKPIGAEDYHRWRHCLKQTAIHQVQTPAVSITDVQISKDIFGQVNDQIKSESHGRLFAVVQIAGKQFKITTEDIIVIQGNFVPTTGNVIRLEKVLLVGSSDFTLVGRPLLNKDLVHIEATVIEKTLSHILTHFRMKRRKQYRRINFYRIPYTMLRINDIRFSGLVNLVQDVEGLEGRIIG